MSVRHLTGLLMLLPLVVACGGGSGPGNLTDFLGPDSADTRVGDDTSDEPGPDDGRPDVPEADGEDGSATDGELSDTGTDATTEAGTDLPADDVQPTDPGLDVPETDAPGTDLGPDPIEDPGTDLTADDAETTDRGPDATADPGSDLPLTDVPSPDVVPDATPPEDPGTAETDVLIPDGSEPAASCDQPVDVWAGKAIGPERPNASLDYESVTGPVTAATNPTCGPAGSQGEVVFRLTIGSPTYAITSVESQAGDFTPVISYVKESCSGPEVDCTLSDNNGRMAELGTALTPGTYLAIVRLIPQKEGLDPVGVALDVSFDFEPGEICDNLEDDNDDGDTDCEDPTCFADPFCTGGHSGEDCSDPFLVNGGLPPAPGLEWFANGTLGGRTDDYHAPLTCWPGSAGSGDAVWRVILDQPMTLEVSVAFYDGVFAHAYVLDATCSSTESCVPPVFTGDPNLLVTLEPGTWNIVVDRGAVPPSNPSFELWISFDEP